MPHQLAARCLGFARSVLTFADWPLRHRPAFFRLGGCLISIPLIPTSGSNSGGAAACGSAPHVRPRPVGLYKSITGRRGRQSQKILGSARGACRRRRCNNCATAMAISVASSVHPTTGIPRATSASRHEAGSWEAGAGHGGCSMGSCSRSHPKKAGLLCQPTGGDGASSPAPRAGLALAVWSGEATRIAGRAAALRARSWDRSYRPRVQSKSRFSRNRTWGIPLSWYHLMAS